MELLRESFVNVLVYGIFSKLLPKNTKLMLFSPSQSSSLDIAVALFGGICNQLVLSLPAKKRKDVVFRVTFDSDKREAELTMESEDRKLFTGIQNANRDNPEAAEWIVMGADKSVYGYRTVFTARMPDDWKQDALASHLIRSFRMGYPGADVKLQHATKGLKPTAVVEFSA
ncbi:MAG: hypothetical protein IJ041_01065 [Clostridia bacterium]|nr:hypothetical protein [Clostridia bacterium]